MSTLTISHTQARCLIQEKVPRGTSKSTIRIQLLEYVANAEKQTAAVPAAIEALEEGLKLQKPGDIWSVDPSAIRIFLAKARAALSALKGDQ